MYDDYFKSLNIDFLSDEEKQEYYAKFQDLFMKFFSLELAESMTEEQHKEFSTLENEEAQFAFFQKHNINYDAIAILVADQLNKTIKEKMTYLKGLTDGLNSK